jgi:triacylglycerol esterase/lipase EstA (alpha/beta hydrolase family)
MASLAFVLPLTPGKTQEWRNLGEEILGPHRSEYQALLHSLGLTTQRWYLQHMPQGERAIIYLPGGRGSPAHDPGTADVSGWVCCLVAATGKGPLRRIRLDSDLTWIAVPAGL